MEFSEATASNRVEILCTAVKDAKCHAVQQTAVLLGGLGGFQNSSYRHTQRSSVLPLVLAFTAGFVVLAVFISLALAPPDNSFGDARNGKIGLTACHIRLDHRHEHFIMVL
jgi:hypothetical protein